MCKESHLQETKQKHLQESSGWIKKQHAVSLKEAALHSSTIATMAAAGETRTAFLHMWHGSWVLF